MTLKSKIRLVYLSALLILPVTFSWAQENRHYIYDRGKQLIAVIDADGSLEWSEFNRLLSQRDDTPVSLAE